MNAPTDKQLAVLRFAHDFVREHGYSPTVRDVCGHFGLKSTNAGNDHRRLLVLKGMLREPVGSVRFTDRGKAQGHARTGFILTDAARAVLVAKYGDDVMAPVAGPSRVGATSLVALPCVLGAATEAHAGLLKALPRGHVAWTMPSGGIVSGPVSRTRGVVVQSEEARR